MKAQREFIAGGRKLSILIDLTDLNDPSWKELTDTEKKELLQTIDIVEKDVRLLKKRITALDAVRSKSLKPGLSPEEVKIQVDEWINRKSYAGFYWDALWINEKTGDVAYSKNLPSPDDDGYIKGFIIAFDIHTNKMIARNCDNIWNSLSKRGYTHLDSMEQFNNFYKGNNEKDL